jgi:solute:Na+ symporter, SSS family
MGSIGASKISSWIIASLLGACTAQAGLQPVLSSKSASQAKKACIITAFVAAPFGIFTALLGMASRVMYENGTILSDLEPAAAAKQALPELMMNMDKVVTSMDPTVAGILGGLVMASILAAILSTVSPIILAAGTMVTRDVYQRVLHPEASDEKVLFMGRLTTAIAGVICAIGAIALVNMSAVLELVYAAYSLRGALFIVVLLGIYWKKSSQKGAIISMILTAIGAIGWVAIKLVTGSYPLKFGDFAITETYVAVVIALVCTIIFSLIFKQSKEEFEAREATEKELAEKMAKA